MGLERSFAEWVVPTSSVPFGDSSPSKGKHLVLPLEGELSPQGTEEVGLTLF